MSAGHPLAPVARQMCRDAHTLARGSLIGRVACGRHWEQVIRADERIAVEEGLPAWTPDQASG